MNEHGITSGSESPAWDGADGEPVLTEQDLEALREALPAMFQSFPELRRLRPDQFADADPVRSILEEFLAKRESPESERPEPSGN
jgi:hypothetical protein